MNQTSVTFKYLRAALEQQVKLMFLLRVCMLLCVMEHSMNIILFKIITNQHYSREQESAECSQIN